jgi:RES domain-containing protein
VRLYRFGSNPFRTAEEEFNGQGGVLSEGRWHFKGTPCVYAALSESLALIEVLVNRRPKEPPSYPLYLADVPDHFLQVLGADDYPKFWQSLYPSAATRRLGTDWLNSRVAVGLLVRSAVSQREYNCLLNPRCSDFSHVTVEGPVITPVDPRLIS